MLNCYKCKKNRDESFFYKDRTKNGQSGYSKACKPCEKAKYKAWYAKNKVRLYARERAPQRRFKYAEFQAKKRNLSWNIGHKLYYKLIKQPCHYCKTLPNEDTIGIGLDRLNNNYGYTPKNVVSCCPACNIGRGTRFTQQEWEVAIQAILKLRLASSTG